MCISVLPRTLACVRVLFNYFCLQEQFCENSILEIIFSLLPTSLAVWWSELLTTNHEFPGSIPGSNMGIFPCRGRIPVVTMVWVVSRIRLKVETSVTRSHNSINSD